MLHGSMARVLMPACPDAPHPSAVALALALQWQLWALVLAGCMACAGLSAGARQVYTLLLLGSVRACCCQLLIALPHTHTHTHTHTLPQTCLQLIGNPVASMYIQHAMHQSMSALAGPAALGKTNATQATLQGTAPSPPPFASGQPGSQLAAGSSMQQAPGGLLQGVQEPVQQQHLAGAVAHPPAAQPPATLALQSGLSQHQTSLAGTKSPGATSVDAQRSGRSSARDAGVLRPLPVVGNLLGSVVASMSPDKVPDALKRAPQPRPSDSSVALWAACQPQKTPGSTAVGVPSHLSRPVWQEEEPATVIGCTREPLSVLAADSGHAHLTSIQPVATPDPFANSPAPASAQRLTTPDPSADMHVATPDPGVTPAQMPSDSGQPLATPDPSLDDSGTASPWESPMAGPDSSVEPSRREATPDPAEDPHGALTPPRMPQEVARGGPNNCKEAARAATGLGGREWEAAVNQTGWRLSAVPGTAEGSRETTPDPDSALAAAGEATPDPGYGSDDDSGLGGSTTNSGSGLAGVAPNSGRGLGEGGPDVARCADAGTPDPDSDCIASGEDPAGWEDTKAWPDQACAYHAYPSADDPAPAGATAPALAPRVATEPGTAQGALRLHVSVAAVPVSSTACPDSAAPESARPMEAAWAEPQRSSRQAQLMGADAAAAWGTCAIAPFKDNLDRRARQVMQWVAATPNCVPCAGTPPGAICGPTDARLGSRTAGLGPPPGSNQPGGASSDIHWKAGAGTGAAPDSSSPMGRLCRRDAGAFIMGGEKLAGGGPASSTDPIAVQGLAPVDDGQTASSGGRESGQTAEDSGQPAGLQTEAPRSDERPTSGDVQPGDAGLQCTAGDGGFSSVVVHPTTVADVPNTGDEVQPEGLDAPAAPAAGSPGDEGNGACSTMVGARPGGLGAGEGDPRARVIGAKGWPMISTTKGVEGLAGTTVRATGAMKRPQGVGAHCTMLGPEQCMQAAAPGTPTASPENSVTDSPTPSHSCQTTSHGSQTPSPSASSGAVLNGVTPGDIPSGAGGDRVIGASTGTDADADMPASTSQLDCALQKEHAHNNQANKAPAGGTVQPQAASSRAPPGGSTGLIAHDSAVQQGVESSTTASPGSPAGTVEDSTPQSTEEDVRTDSLVARTESPISHQKIAEACRQESDKEGPARPADTACEGSDGAQGTGSAAQTDHSPEAKYSARGD